MQQTAVVALITGILTATVALMASWLTSRATISAARVNVTSNAQTQRRERARDLRRTAYVDLLTYVTEVRWRVRDLIHRAGAGDETALIDFRNGRNVVGGELARRRYVVYLEGPELIREPVERLQAAFDRWVTTLIAPYNCMTQTRSEQKPENQGMLSVEKLSTSSFRRRLCSRTR